MPLQDAVVARWSWAAGAVAGGRCENLRDLYGSVGWKLMEITFTPCQKEKVSGCCPIFFAIWVYVGMFDYDYDCLCLMLSIVVLLMMPAWVCSFFRGWRWVIETPFDQKIQAFVRILEQKLSL